MILVSCKPEIEKPTVVTKSVGEVTETTAKVVGQVTADGGAEISERGVCWNTTAAPEVIDYRMKDVESGLGIYEVNVANLLPNTTYYVRAYATNEKGVSYGEEKTFTTLEVTPEEPGDEPEEPGDEPEEPGDEPEEPGDEPEEPGDEPEEPGDEPEEPGDEPEEPGDEPEEPGDEPEEPGDEPENPGDEPEEPGDEPENPGDEPEEPGDEPEEPGDEPEEPIEPEKPVGPVVITAEVTEITINSAVCGGDVISGGDAVVVARGVCWNTTGSPTVSDTYTMDGTNVGIFTSNIPDLVPNTQYYVRAYATNAKGVTGYGEEVTFTTLEKLLPIVTTSEVTDITLTSAVCGGEVTFDGNVAVTAKGICWNTTGTPTIGDNKTTNGEGIGSYTSNMTGLEHGTTYYVRAYATNEVGTAYGEEVSFITKDIVMVAVDLGLSVKWATCNVGAYAPEEYGDYFAWGETSAKLEYNSSNCPTYGLSISELQSQGYIDNDGNLTPQYDAATVNWGGDWRMPTYDELNELRNNCTWTWTTQNGVIGYSVTGPNGNSIFLPTAGYRYESSLYHVGNFGSSWSSTPCEDNANYAYYLRLFYFTSSTYNILSDPRCHGYSVRPVLE